MLETEPGLPDWNVIHLMGMDDPENVSRLPDQFDLQLRRINPEWSHKELYRGLTEMRDKLRHIIAVPVPELTRRF